MKPYIVILQFGPVQDFIHTARRTDDYWAGSFLLSFATAHAIKMLKDKGGEIIFPDPEGNELAAAVEKGTFDTEESLFPSLPNRMGVRMLSEDVDNLKLELDDLKSNVLLKLQAMFDKAEHALTGSRTFSGVHVEDMFEFYYAFAEDDQESPCSAFQTAEERLAARKNIRDFKPFEQKGFKCTQCGFREPLGKNPLHLVDLKNYWKEIRGRKHNLYRYVFKDNERLCSICAGKRLLRRECFNGGAIPSTSTIAVSAWVAQIGEKIEKKECDTNNLMFLLCKFFDALKQADLSMNMAPVPANSGKTGLMYKIEGDCFIDDAYDRFEKEAKDEGKEARAPAIQKARKKLKDFLESLPSDIRTPPKYFTILAFDGDNMGDYKKTLKTCRDHQEFSGQLAGFAKTVYGMVREKYHGYVIYSGGDEGVILVPLSETLAVMEELRNAFRQLKDSPTLSAGAAIVHHQAPLGVGLKAANEALETHAKNVRGKNAFSICIRKRSGSRTICRAPWEVETDDGPQGMMDFLKEWEDAYRKDLSPRWYHRMRPDLPTIREEDNRYDPEMAQNMFFHVLPRQSPENNKELGRKLAKDIQRVMTSHEAFDDIENLLSLLYVPIYLFEGGQD